jgi:hypothetical protein
MITARLIRHDVPPTRHAAGLVKDGDDQGVVVVVVLVVAFA